MTRRCTGASRRVNSFWFEVRRDAGSATDQPYVIHRMAADRVPRIIADYERDAHTDASACLEVLIAAGEGDADAVFAGLTPELRDLVARDVTGVEASKTRIIESYCGTGPPEAYEADLRRREELMRRGIVALQRITSGGTRRG